MIDSKGGVNRYVCRNKSQNREDGLQVEILLTHKVEKDR